MPLIDLKTKLKDLKYPSGPAPYVRKDIKNPGTPAANQIQARQDDVTRIAGIFSDKPGAKFTGKQALLQASQITSITDIALGNTVIPVAARLGSLLAQIPVNGTGTHFSNVEFAGRNATYARNTSAASEAKYGGKVTTRRNSQYLNPVFKYDQILQSNNLSYNSTIGESPAATLAKQNGEIKISRFTPNSANKETYSLSKQVPGGRSLEVQYGFAGPNQSDKVNLLAIGEDGDDLVPLKISVIGEENSLLVFRGFYQSLSDTYNASWGDNSYIGRAESLYTYSKFSRALSFSFKVPIFSAVEQGPVYDKVNTFLSYTAPSYSENGFPKGTIIKLEIGDFIHVNGVINSIGMSVAQDVPWSEGLSEILLPQVIDLTVNFSAIHSFIPQVITAGTRPYIAPGNTPGEAPIILPARESVFSYNTTNRSFGPQLAQATTNLLRGLLNTSTPALQPRETRPVVTTDDGTFGPPIFD